MKNIVGLSFFLLLSFQGCSAQTPSFQGTEFERYTNFKDAGFDKVKLDDFTKYLEETSATTGMLVLHDGKILYEYGDIKEISYLASCRKSILSILYGKHVKSGKIDLNETLGELEIDDNDALLPIEKTATVNHIITAKSGVFHLPANGGYDKKNALKRGSVKPGEYFLYNNWDYNVAGHILEKKTGKTVYQELEEQLAKPLGFQDWNIKNQKRTINEKNSRYSAYHMYLSTRDMAKIGQLMLDEGRWKGRQIVPKDWIKKITTTVTPVETVNKRYGRDSSSKYQFSYGYMWWLFEKLNDNPAFEGAYSATGFGGQFITVIPKLNLVVAHKTKLGLLTRWGVKPGGISNSKYWEILQKLANAKTKDH